MQIKLLKKDEYLHLERSLHLHPLQSYAWGEVKSPSWRPMRVGVFKDETPVAAFLILTRRIPLFGKSFGYIPRATLCENSEAFKEVFEQLNAFCKNQGLSHILLDPDLPFTDSEKQKASFEQILNEAGFMKQKRQIQPNRTVVLDLSKSEEELFSAMRSKHRQYIRKAKRDGVRIRLGKDRDLEVFCEVIKSIIAVKGHVMHDCGYYKKVWELFSKADRAVLFVAERDNAVLGSYMIILNDDNAYEMYGGCNEEGNRLRANYLMKWEAINYCKKLGKKYYDQWGAEPWYPGLVQFKEGFGGKILEYPSQYVYIYDRAAYTMYKFLERVNRIKQNLPF